MEGYYFVFTSFTCVRKYIDHSTRMEGYYFVFASFTCVRKDIGHSTRILSLSVNGRIRLRIYFVHMHQKRYWSQYPYSEPKPERYYFVFTLFTCVRKDIGHSTRILSLSLNGRILLRIYFVHMRQKRYLSQYRILSLSLNGRILLRIYFVHMRQKRYWSQYPYSEPKTKWKDTASYLLRSHASENI